MKDTDIESTQTEKANNLSESVKHLAELLMKGDGEGALAMMDTAMKEALHGSVNSLWGQLTAAFGAFEGFGGTEQSERDGYKIVLMELRFAGNMMLMQTTFNADGLVTGLFVRAGKLGEENPSPLESLVKDAKRLTELLIKGDGEEALAMMDNAMREALKSSVNDLWGQITASFGSFEDFGGLNMTEQDGYKIVLSELRFVHGTLLQRTVFNAEGLVAGLQLTPGTLSTAEPPPAEALPENIEEASVSFAADERYPIHGTLTLPREGHKLTAIVLVHGSGPNNRDETVGANRPFYDLARGLAERGFAVLRYDKRTFTYGAQIAGSPDYKKLTVDEETADDAAAAVRFLQNDARIEADKVYLLGHSLGGMLMSYIGTKTDCAGYIVMAGTPRKLWTISMEQNLLAANEYAEAGNKGTAEQIRAFIEAESKKAAALSSLSDDEAQKDTVFGILAWYQRHLESFDAAALHMADRRAALFLWGAKDRQVYETDWKLWQERLAGHPDALFKAYPTLNHLFGEYTGEPVPFARLVTQEYAARTPVPDEVIDDIAAWLRRHA